MGTDTPVPQTLPLGTYGTSTRRHSLDAFGSWSRHLGGLTPLPHSKNPGYVPAEYQ